MKFGDDVYIIRYQKVRKATFVSETPDKKKLIVFYQGEAETFGRKEVSTKPDGFDKAIYRQKIAVLKDQVRIEKVWLANTEQMLKRQKRDLKKRERELHALQNARHR